MSSSSQRRSSELFAQFAVQYRRFGWLVYGLFLVIGITIFQWVWFSSGDTAVRDSHLQSLLIDLSAGFIGGSIIFLFIVQFAQWSPDSEHEKEHQGELNDLKVERESLVSDVRKALEGSEKHELNIIDSRKEVYNVAIAALNREGWHEVCIFAPVGLWQIDDDKRRWFDELVACSDTTKRNRVRMVKAIFGLPPKNRDGEEIEHSEVIENLRYAKSMLDKFKELKNVELHYYPPVEASVGSGALLFKRSDKTGLVAWAISSASHEEIIDYAVAFEDTRFFVAADEWFHDRLFAKATGKFRLQDGATRFSDKTWSEVVERYYGKSYL